MEYAITVIQVMLSFKEKSTCLKTCIEVNYSSRASSTGKHSFL